MRKVVFVILFSFSLLLPVVAVAAESDSAPFGLTWGMSVSQVKGLGVKLDPDSDLSFGHGYFASKLSKSLPDVAAVGLFFGFDDKLWKIIAVSQDFKNDPYGGALLNRYNDLFHALSNKYGLGVHHESRDNSIFTKPDEFLMGLKAGRTWWYSEFNSQAVNVELEIDASDMQTGYWKIIFTNKLLESDFKKSKISREENAL